MADPATSRANSIGLARLLLAGAVVYGHSWYFAARDTEEPVSRWLFAGADAPAPIGVKGFFVLSGYLVLGSEQRLESARRFLWHRFLRIYPGLWACLLVTGLLFPLVAWSLGHGVPHWSSAWRYVVANAVLIREAYAVEGLFAHVPRAGDLNGSLWTLPYEIACYVGLAAFGWLGLTRRGSTWPWLVAAGFLALYIHDLVRPEAGVFFKSEGRRLCVWFVVGGAVALADPVRVRAAARGLWAALGVAAYAVACRTGAATLLGPFLLLPTFLWLMWGLPWHDFETRARGDYSYGLYIYACPVQQALAAMHLHETNLSVYIAASFLVTLLLAVASWHLVEKHALRLKSLGRR